MKKLHNFVMVLLLVLSTNALAGPQKDYFADEVWAATRIAYNFSLLYDVEPVVCPPFPVEFELFYRSVQDEVNADVESYPKRERGKLGVTIGWKVWAAIQDLWGC